MTIYRFVKRLSEGCVVLYNDDYGSQIWARCKIRAAKECYITGIKLKGKEGYSPIGSQKYNRMDRISVEGIKYLEEKSHG